MPTTPNSIITAQSLNVSSQAFVNADGTGIKDIFVAGVNGALLNSLIAQSTDGSNRNIKLYYNDGSASYPIGTLAVAANAGNTGAIASVNLLNTALIPGLSMDSSGNPQLKLKPGHKIQGSMLVAVTAAAQITVNAFGEDL